MSGSTTELGLRTATDSDDNADYLTIDLANSLRTLDALLNNVTGHNHAGAHQGGPLVLGTSNIADASITSAKIADGTITATDCDPSVYTLGGDLKGTVPSAAIVLRNASGIYALGSDGTQHNVLTLGSETLYWDAMGGGYRWVNQPNSQQWMALNNGNLAVAGTVSAAAASISGGITANSFNFQNGSVAGTITAAGANISNINVAGTVSAGAVNSNDWFRLNTANVGIYNNATGTGIAFTSGGQLLHPSGDQIVGIASTQTLNNKTLINGRMWGPAGFAANGNDLTNYAFNYYSSTVTLPQPSATYVGVFRGIKAWGADITINCGSAVLAGPGATGMSASFVIKNGDSVTLWCDGSYWWVL